MANNKGMWEREKTYVADNRRKEVLVCLLVRAGLWSRHGVGRHRNGRSGRPLETMRCCCRRFLSLCVRYSRRRYRVAAAVAACWS